jgi:hypothetical protein
VNIKIIKKLEDIIIITAITLTGILFLFYFKTKHSMGFINLDELLWMYRSRFFMDNLFNLNFSGLLQAYHPGTMVMWLSGPFMKIIDYDFNSISNFINNLNSSGVGYNIINHKNQWLYDDYKELGLLFNIPILSLIFIFIFSVCYLLKKLKFNRWIIIFSLLLITTTPYYIYFTTPTDKFVGIFSVLSILCLLVFASKKGGRKFFILSAILCSFAVLSKFSALFLVPFSLFVLVFYKCCRDEAVPRLYSVKNIIKDYLSWLAIFSATTIIFLPTIITDPNSVLNLIIKQSSERSLAQNQGYGIFLNFKVIAAYLSDSFLLSFNLFVIIIFMAFICLLIGKIKNKISINKEITILITYFFTFFIFIVLFSKTYSFRYLVPILIIFQIIAGVGIYEFSNIFIEKNNVKNKNLVYSWIIAFILISQGLLIYYSELEKIEELPLF